jgi:hypothetical protein
MNLETPALGGRAGGRTEGRKKENGERIAFQVTGAVFVFAVLEAEAVIHRLLVQLCSGSQRAPKVLAITLLQTGSFSP